VLERSILLQVEHPFIVKLVRSLSDSNNVYFLMEFIKGKELFDAIRDIGLLNKSQTQFYGASIMIAINYLHKRQFIYRDIKPENIMVNENVILFVKVGVYQSDRFRHCQENSRQDFYHYWNSSLYGS
jgi:serine/threonine protein kinase